MKQNKPVWREGLTGGTYSVPLHLPDPMPSAHNRRSPPRRGPRNFHDNTSIEFSCDQSNLKHIENVSLSKDNNINIRFLFDYTSHEFMSKTM